MPNQQNQSQPSFWKETLPDIKNWLLGAGGAALGAKGAAIIPGLRSAKEFAELGSLQRGKPEQAMLGVQFKTGGGVINPVVEHSGDLVHRMTEMAPYNSFGYEYVKPKIERVTRILTNPYGFEREMNENINNTAAYRNVDPNQLRDQIAEALRNFGNAHAELPAYNEAHDISNNINYNLGYQNWGKAVQGLDKLNQHLGSSNEWDAFASQGLKK